MPARLLESELNGLSARQKHILKCERLLDFIREAAFPYSYSYTHPTRGAIGVRVTNADIRNGDLLVWADAGILATGVPLRIAAPIRFVNPPVKIQTGGQGENAVFAFRPLQALAHALGHTLSLMPENPDHIAAVADDPTLTAYPDPDPETTTIDGHVRRSGVDQTFSAIRSGAGTNQSSTSAAQTVAQMIATTTTDQFERLVRFIMLFDTGSVSSPDTVDSVTCSLYGTAKSNGLGSTGLDLDIVNSSPASNTALAASDYGNVGTTVYGSVAYSSYSASAYNDITLSTTAVTKAGITKLGARLSWDTDNSFGGTWASGAQTYFSANNADQTGTTNDPKLVVVYTVGSTRRRWFVVS